MSMTSSSGKNITEVGKILELVLVLLFKTESNQDIKTVRKKKLTNVFLYLISQICKGVGAFFLCPRGQRVGKGQIKSKSRLASRRFSQKTNRPI